MAIEIQSKTTELRAHTIHRVEVDGYVVTWEIGQALCCFRPGWQNTPVTAADIRKESIILSEIADTLDAAEDRRIREQEANGR